MLYDSLRGSATPTHYERVCIDAWRTTLNSEMQRILDIQLASVSMIQRQADGAKLCFYYPEKSTAPLFPTIEPDLHVATVVLGDGCGQPAKQMKVKVWVHRGKFFSIEFPKRPKRFVEQHGLSLEKLRPENTISLIELASTSTM
jgi:hypothetical protein